MQPYRPYYKIIMLFLVSLTLSHSVPNHAMAGYMPSRDTFKGVGVALCVALGGFVFGHWVKGSKQNYELHALKQRNRTMELEFNAIKELNAKLLFQGIYAPKDNGDRDLILRDGYTTSDIANSLNAAYANMQRLQNNREHQQTYETFKQFMMQARRDDKK